MSYGFKNLGRELAKRGFDCSGKSNDEIAQAAADFLARPAQAEAGAEVEAGTIVAANEAKPPAKPARSPKKK